jgi:hypothetical protein
MSTAAAPAIVSKPLTRRERSAANLYRRLIKAQERASAMYELSDRIGYKLAQKLGGDLKTVRISVEGKGIQVIDNYQAAIRHPKRQPEQMPKAWAHGSVRQFEFKEIQIFS